MSGNKPIASATPPEVDLELSSDLLERLEDAAAEVGRSVEEEIKWRLRQSLAAEPKPH